MKRLKLEEENQTMVVTDNNSGVFALGAEGINIGPSNGSGLVVMGSNQLPPRSETTESARNMRDLLPGCGMDGVDAGESVGMGVVSRKVASSIQRDGSSNLLLVSLPRFNSFRTLHNSKSVTRSNSILSFSSDWTVGDTGIA